MKLRIALAWALASSLLAGGCSSPSGSAPASGQSTAGGASAAPRTFAPTASPAPAARIEGTFDVGGGKELYIRCIGTGSPTILLEAGDGDTGAGHWRDVYGPLSAQARTCTYDRAGLGRSDPATGCRQLQDLLDDLDGLLAAAEIEGPYVLVGASGGGFIMAGFAARHPADVAGMVFVETPKALTAALYPDVVPQIACDAPGNVERRDYLNVEHAAWDNRKEIGEFPVTVLSNDYGDAVEPQTDEATNVADQRGWLDLTSGATRQVVVRSGHNVASNEPDLVIDEILAVLAAARAAST